MHWPLALVPCATFLYVVFDLYGVVNSFLALFRSASFWLLWLLFSILNAVAFILFEAAGLKTLTASGIDSSAAPVLILFFSTIGTFSILQSFSLKFANFKAINLEQMFEKLRAGVLTEAAFEKSELRRIRQQALAARLAVFFAANPATLDVAYERIMTFGGISPAKISANIAAASQSPRGKIPTLTNTMVFADERGSRELLKP